MTIPHELWLVALSVAIAVQGSFVGLSLSLELDTATGFRRRLALAGSALTLATGVWSMHFVGMLAASFPSAVDYLVLPTLVSFLICVIVVGVGVYAAHAPGPQGMRIGFGALAMGLGICAMHYVGMSAVHLAGPTYQQPPFVAASVAVSVAASALALWALGSRPNRSRLFLAALVLSLALGVGADSLVAIALERSPEMIIALLATLKAGGAYVPLDPDYPTDRLAFMLEDSQAKVLITQTSLLARLPHGGGPTLCLEAGGLRWPGPQTAGLEVLPDHNPERPVAPHDLAYVIYTSGSTGRPKGVMNIHSAIQNRLQWMQETFPLGASDRVLQKTPSSFDVSVWEFFWPLIVGACVVVAAPGGLGFYGAF